MSEGVENDLKEKEKLKEERNLRNTNEEMTSYNVKSSLYAPTIHVQQTVLNSVCGSVLKFNCTKWVVLSIEKNKNDSLCL